MGHDFLTAISGYGKRQNIIYGGQNSNQAAGSAMGYKLLRKHHDATERVLFSEELHRTISASGMNLQRIGELLYNTKLPGWNGSSTASPFQSIAPPIPVSGHAPKTPAEFIAGIIQTWIDRTAFPTNDEMDILCLVLRRWLNNGVGVGTRINYDPHKVLTTSGSRPPHVALFHELVHAYYNAAGSQLGREDSASENNGGRLFELMSTGLPPFDAEPYSENKFRSIIGVAPRKTYP